MADIKQDEKPSVAAPAKSEDLTLSRTRLDCSLSRGLISLSRKENAASPLLPGLKAALEESHRSLSELFEKDLAAKKLLTPQTSISIQLIEGHPPKLAVEGIEKTPENEKLLSTLARKLFGEGELPPAFKTISRIASIWQTAARNGKDPSNPDRVKEQIHFETDGTLSEIGLGVGMKEGKPTFSLVFRGKI